MNPKSLREILELLRCEVINIHCDRLSVSEIIKRQREAIEQAISDIEKIIVPNQEDLWRVLAKVNDCKNNQEDCSAKRCNHWAGCSLLILLIDACREDRKARIRE